MTDPLKATPPAIVRADSAAVDQLVFEINGAVELGAQHATKGAEAYRQAGLALLKLKDQLSHGEFAAIIVKRINGKSLRTCRRWMALAKRDAASDLDDAWRHICGHYDADLSKDEPASDVAPTTSQAPNANPSPIFCRPCRVGTPKKGCKGCEALRRPPREAGDDTESEDADKAADKKAAAERRKANAGNGQVLFDWKNFQSHFGPVAQAPDKIAKGYPNEKDSPEFREAQQLLQQFIVLMERWQKRLQRTK